MSRIHVNHNQWNFYPSAITTRGSNKSMKDHNFSRIKIKILINVILSKKNNFLLGRIQ
jgi:hypothetical protein